MQTEASCGKPARQGAPCNLDPAHIARGERHSNGKFSWALRGHEAKEAEALALAPFIPPSTKKQPRCSSGYGNAGQCQLFAKHLGIHFACTPSPNGPSGFEVQTWTDAGDGKSWTACGVRKELEYNGDKPEPKKIRNPRDRILCLRPGHHAGEHIGLDNVGNHTCQWKDGSPASVHSPKFRIDFVASLLGQKFEYRWDDDEEAVEPAENLKPCPAEDMRGFACSKVASHDGEHSNARGWESRCESRHSNIWHEPAECRLYGGHKGDHEAEVTVIEGWPETGQTRRIAWDDRGHGKGNDILTSPALVEPREGRFKQYGFALQVADGGLLCHDGVFRELANPVSGLDHEQSPHVFATKQRAGSQAHWLERATTTVPYFVDDAGHNARVGVEAEEPRCAFCKLNPPLPDSSHCGTAKCRRAARAKAASATAPTEPQGEETKTMETIDTESAPKSNGKLKTAPPKKARRVEMIARDNIAPDPNQPRKTFDETKLAELAASIAIHGVEQPIVVRPNLRSPHNYIIIFGERRWRAAGLAGLTEVPSIIDSDADDDAALLLERQLVENAQRDDINPLEEGEALNTLHTKHGYSIEELTEKTGKSRSHVYSRIALTKLAAGVKKAIGEGRLPHAHGGLIGTIPDLKAQEQCCKEVLGELAPQALRALEDIGVSHEQVTDDANRRVMYSDGKPQVLSFRATAALIRRRYQTRLQLASFDPADASLTVAGACGPCQYNSGNQPELPGIAAPTKDGSYCSNLACFEKKTQAAFKRVADAAKAQGKKVFEGKKAESMLSHNGEIKPDTGFVAPDQRLPWNLVGSYDDKFTYKRMLGKHLAEVPTAIVQNDRGAPVEVLDIEKAHEVLKEHKLLPKKASASSSKPTAADKRAKAKQKEEKAAEKLRDEAVPYFVAQAAAAAKELPATKNAALWRMLALFVREFFDYDAGALYRGMYDDEDPHDHIGERAEKLKDEADLRSLVVELVVIQAGADIASGSGMTDEAMELATKILGLDWKKAEKLALIGREQKKVNDALEKQAEAAKATKKKGGRK